jgi:hypothetical protein
MLIKRLATEITPNRVVYNIDLEKRIEKQRPKWYYNNLEDVHLEDIPHPREQWPRWRPMKMYATGACLFLFSYCSSKLNSPLCC